MATIYCDCGDESGQPDFDGGKYDYQGNGEIVLFARFACSSCKKVVAEREIYLDARGDGKEIGDIAVGTYNFRKYGTGIHWDRKAMKPNRKPDALTRLTQAIAVVAAYQI